MSESSEREQWAERFMESMECPECGSIMFPEASDQPQYTCSSGTCQTEVRLTDTNIIIRSYGSNRPLMQEVLAIRTPRNRCC